MALDQEYFEKALEILKSKGFSDKEADQIATTLSVYLPMRFIQASDWEEIPSEQRPENTFAVVALGWYDRIPELRKPIIYKMPSDLTFTTYGQSYIPGTDTPAFTTTPDGYTRAPFDWHGSCAGEPGVMGQDGNDNLEISNLTLKQDLTNFRYQLPPESLIKRFTVVMSVGGKPTKMTLEELVQKIGGYDKLPTSARAAIASIMEQFHNTPIELGGALDDGLPKISIRSPLPGGVSEEQARYLKLDNLSDIEGIKRAYPNISDEESERLSSTHRLLAQRFSDPERRPSLFERLIDPDQFAQDIKDDLSRLKEKAGPREVGIQSSFKRVLGGGLVIETPLFGQHFKHPTGPQTMPGLEKGLNGKPQRRKKGKGKRYERGY